MILGLSAFTYSQEEAILNWERTFLPSERMVDFALGSRSLSPVTNLTQLERVLRFLPARLDEKGSIWIQEEPLWVAFYLSSGEGGASSEPRVYCFKSQRSQDCKGLPKNWQSAGIGWRGLGILIDKIDQILELRQKNLGRPNQEPIQDPREVIY